MNDAIPTLQAAAGESGNNKPMAAISFQERSGKPGGGKGILIQNERTGALSTLNNQSVMYDQKSIVYGICSKDSNSMKSENPNSGIYVADKTRTLDINCGNPACNQGGMAVVSENKILTSSKASFFLQTHNDETAETLVATDYKDPQIVCKKNESDFQNPIVRRLTPLECERLQGFPDNWTNIGDWKDSKGKIHKGESDSPRYKALGNSIAIPFWQWMAEKMIPFLGEEATMASLFDGIGGFPLAFSRVGIKPVWASEIEEFPIAVTKRRFPDEE